MITVGYGMHRTKEEVLVGEMMGRLAEKPYKNLKFLSLDDKDWGYLASHTNGFVFDVHGGTAYLKIFNNVIDFPGVAFLLFSNVVEDEFVNFLKEYRTGNIYLVHKEKRGPLLGSFDYWLPLPSAGEFFKKTVDKLGYELIDRIVGIECLNAREEWQIEHHRSFMEMFLNDLDNFADSKESFWADKIPPQV